MPFSLNQPTVKRFIVTVPSLYWDRNDGRTPGNYVELEVLSTDHKTAVQQAMPDLLPLLARACNHFSIFQIAAARCARNPERRTVKHFRVKRSGRIVARELRPWMSPEG